MISFGVALGAKVLGRLIQHAVGNLLLPVDLVTKQTVAYFDCQGIVDIMLFTEFSKADLFWDRMVNKFFCLFCWLASW